MKAYIKNIQGYVNQRWKGTRQGRYLKRRRYNRKLENKKVRRIMNQRIRMYLKESKFGEGMGGDV